MRRINTKIKKKNLDGCGFTLLELMIAVTIFGFLILYVAQLMGSEIKLYNNASKQNDLDHEARTAMMHIMDELRLKDSKFFLEGEPGGYNRGVAVPSNPSFPYINLKPSDESNLPEGTVIFLVKNISSEGYSLKYRDGNVNHLISNHIDTLSLTSKGSHLIKIDLTVKDPSIGKTYNLVSYMRLY